MQHLSQSPNGCKSSYSILDFYHDLRRVASTGGGEYAGPCPGCGGKDRFRCWPSRGRYWCRGCGRKGDTIQYLRDFRGLTFFEAQRALGLDPSPPSQELKRKARIHSFALKAAKQRYHDWQRRIFSELIEQYHVLSAEKDIAEIAYRAIHQAQSLYTPEERRFWTHKLASVYDRLVALEHHLDILTYSDQEPACFSWWQEVCREQRV